ncbi:MAG: hypothetical protein IMZ55_06475 [Acidobacteria bacterium]|nr:hypothetical protein [Acidobacteriota bacterium]
MRHWLLAGALATALAMPACNTSHTVKVEPVEIKPIHITMDINIKIEREVDDFFDEVEKKAAETNPGAQTVPSSGDQK